MGILFASMNKRVGLTISIPWSSVNTHSTTSRTSNLRLIPPNLVYSSSEKVLPLSDGTYTPIGPELPSIAGLHEGTILVRFTPTAPTASTH